MIKNTSYYRARLKAFVNAIHSSSQSNGKSDPVELLKYGFVHDDIKKDIDSYIEKTSESNAELSFTEITSFNTWFAMHPEKIAGQELLTTSREFPITIKGTKDEIIKIISSDNDKRIRIIKVKALAKLKLLKLLN